MAEVLAVWREAERLLLQLDESDDQWPEVAFAVRQMRLLYWRLTDQNLPETYRALDANWDTIDRARALLRRIEERYGRLGG